MRSPFLKILVMILLVSFFADRSYSQERCSFDRDHQEKLNDPEYRDFLKQVRGEIRRIKNENFRIECTAGNITFPVAIHYNWIGIGTVVDQCMIDAATNSINALNDDYLGQNADLSNYDALTTTCSTYYPASAKSTGSCIDFCIAKYDHPSCSGLCDDDLAITAGQYSYPNTGGCFSDYINIFVEGNTGGLGVAPLFGVTTLGGNGPQIDASAWGGPGVNCTPNGLGNSFNSFTQYNLGRTLTHEMGHYFGLQHVFVSTGVADCSTDDGYADTPVQSQENFSTPVVINCDPNDGGNTAGNTCSTLDMWCSYMDYSDDTHLFMFTTMQSDEMYASAQTSPISDATIKCTGGTADPTADMKLANGLPVFCTNDSSPYTIDFEDNSSRCPTSWSWTFSGAGASPATSILENPTVTVNISGDLTATLVSTNGQGASSMVTKTYYISIADAGSCPDCGPKLYDIGGPNSGYSANETSTWNYCAGSGEVLSLSVSDVDMLGNLFTDWVRIYEGATLPADLNSFVAILGENGGTGGGFWESTGGGSYSFLGSTFQSTTNCLTFHFTSDGVNEGTGWDMDLGCCDAAVVDPECVGNNSGGTFNTTISSYCTTKTIFDLGDFKKDDVISDSRTCGAVSYSNNSFFQITCDSDGVLLSEDVSTNLDNGGLVDAYIIGPVTGNCPDYTSGETLIADCATASTGTISLSVIGVAANSKYFIFLNSEQAGTFDIESTGSAVGNVLPIKLANFKAEKRTKNVLLSWETELESNNDFFTLEKSADGFNFDRVMQIKSKGDTYSGHKYEYLDKYIFNGYNYYRLTQTDLDGSFQIVGLAQLKIEILSSKFKIFPNPSTTNTLNIIDLIPEKEYELYLYNAIGEELKFDVQADQIGSAIINVKGLRNGLYFIVVDDGSVSQVSKYIKN